ncbi:MAG: FtsX-like permease family protein [Candidatus Thorarchaeota archaeon]
MTDESIIPKMGHFRPKDRISYFWHGIRSLGRNKRRSLSMTAGLILGISILSGISLYSTVLMANVYESIIEGSPYEIRMDFRDVLNDSQIEDYNDMFLEHPWVSDSEILYGNSRTIIQQSGGSTNIYTPAYLQAEIRVEYNNETHSGSNGLLYSKKLYNSEIGRNIRERLITGINPDIYTNTSPYYYGVLITEALAESAKLSQGNRLSELRLSIGIEDPNDPGYPFVERKEVASVVLANVTIAGILSAEEEASAGLFSEAIEFGGGGGEIYIPKELLEKENKVSFFEDLKKNEMRYCALKINEDEFDLSNPSGVSRQINQLINEFEADEMLIGTNEVEGKLLPFEVMSVFIFIFDGILTIPVAILSLYLLSFGIDISLQDRRYQVGILKTQGASPKQIKRKILFEALLLAAFGLIVGYIVAVFGAWVIGTATGFMKWSDTALEELPDFTRLLINIDQNALFVVGGFVVIILILMVNGKANTFISMEITETVRRTDETKKANFLRRNNLDIIFFGIGLFVLILVFLQEYGIAINLGPIVLILGLLGPPFFWIGGAAVVARLAVWLPSKTDPIVKRIGFLKDVSVLIKGNIFRKSGDIPRLALIISLTVSFAVLAAVHGSSGEAHQLRLITYSVGADMTVTTTMDFATTTISKIKSIDDIQEVMAITSTAGILRHDPISIYSVDPEVYATVGIWHSDAIPKEEHKNKDELMAALNSNPNGCLIGRSALVEEGLQVGQNVSIDVLTYFFNTTSFLIEFDYVPCTLTILGEFDHTPAGIGSSSLIISHNLLYNLMDFSTLSSIFDTFPEEYKENFPPFLVQLIKNFVDNPKEILASKYLVQVKESANVEKIKETLRQDDRFKDWVIKVTTLKGEIKKANELKQMDYGIPGLLTADFVISLVAATLATFIFMSILMEQRKKEFAILRSYGASQRQIYKVVFSETIVLLLTAVLWGLFIGLGLSILFNPFFGFMDLFITPLSTLVTGGGQINRLLVFDWVELLSTMLVTFFAMLVATFLSVRGASKAKISTVVREL